MNDLNFEKKCPHLVKITQDTLKPIFGMIKLVLGNNSELSLNYVVLCFRILTNYTKKGYIIGAVYRYFRKVNMYGLHFNI